MFASVVLIALLAVETAWLLRDYFGHPGQPFLGADQQFYRDVGLRFLETGQYLHPHQLQGPHDQIPGITVLYPPTALFLFVPFALLPAIAWWIVPMGLLAFALYRLRPAPWTWVVMLALLMWPRAIGAYLVGNTDMWAVAFIALGLLYGWPVVLLAVKPLYLPFALVGAFRRVPDQLRMGGPGEGGGKVDTQTALDLGQTRLQNAAMTLGGAARPVVNVTARERLASERDHVNPTGAGHDWLASFHDLTLRRSTLAALLLLSAASLLMLPLWFQYAQAMLDMRVDATYWAASIPLLVIPLVAWVGRQVQPIGVASSVAQLPASSPHRNLSSEPASRTGTGVV